MTRKSKREIERELDELDGGESSQDHALVWEDEQTGQWYASPDYDTPIEKTSLGSDPLMIIVREEVVETDWEGGR